MTRYSRSKTNENIELTELICEIWKNKILVISLSFFLALIGYLYGINKEDVYETKITLIDAPPSVFEEYRLFIKVESRETLTKKKRNIASNFNDNFKINLLSHDILYEFAQNYDQIDQFRTYIKNKNIDLGNYFQGKIFATNTEDEKIANTFSYTLNFQKPLPGEIFLNDYVHFVKEKTRASFSKELSRVILNKLKIYNQNLIIAEKINLQNPILKSMVEGNTVVNEPVALFYKGTKVLTQEIAYLEESLKNAMKFNLDYNLVLEKATTPSLISKPPIIFGTICLLIGIFSSLIIILFRYLLLQKS